MYRPLLSFSISQRDDKNSIVATSCAVPVMYGLELVRESCPSGEKEEILSNTDPL
jgi:hypothetical protein